MPIIIGYTQGQIVPDPDSGGGVSGPVLPPPNPNYGTGDPIIALAGSGDAQPRGLEVLFEYNTLEFNNWDIRDRIIVTSIDGLADAEIASHSEPDPTDDGEIPMKSRYRGRTIAMKGRIEATSVPKMRDMIQAFKTAFLDINYEHPLIFKTDNSRHDIIIRCKKAALDIPEVQANMHAYRDFMLTLRASKPWFLSRYEQASDSPQLFADLFSSDSSISDYDVFPVAEAGDPPLDLHLYPSDTLLPGDDVFPY